VHVVGGVEADSGVPVVVVVPLEELSAPVAGVGQTGEAVRVVGNATKLGLADHQPAVLISGGVVMPAVFARA
jgi:hypothetical protein